MEDVSLTTGKIWSFTDNNSNAFRLSLSEALLLDTPLHHSPTPSYLAPIQHELLASILQVAVDSLWSRGLSKKQYSRLILSEKISEARTIISQICEVLDTLTGFNLVGSGAFMQMPTAWRFTGSKMPIARLMWPFIPNVKGSKAKGLRRMTQVPEQIGPDLTALFLFSTCVLSKGGLNFWSIGNLVGRILRHQHQRKTLRQQLFQAVLPSFSDSWKPIQPLPWIAHCHNNGGLESNNFPPWINHLTGKRKIQGSANIRFYQSRAVILEPPDHGICNINGNHTIIFRNYQLLSEKGVYNQIKKHPRFSKTKKHAGILTGLYLKQEHPSVINTSLDGLHCFIPKLYTLQEGSKRLNVSPILQIEESIQNKTIHAAHGEVSIFHLSYGANKQDVKKLHCYQGTTYSPHSGHYLKVEKIIATAEQSIVDFRKGITCLLRKRKTKALGKKEKEFLQQELSICRQYFQHSADLLLNSDINTNANSNWEYTIISNFQEKLKYLWNKLLNHYRNIASMSLADHWQEYDATTLALGRNSMYPNQPYLESRPIVKAGRAFALAYQNLSGTEKYQLFEYDERCYASQSFWKCMRKARQHDPNLFQPMFEQLLPLLRYTKPIQDARSIGNILYSHQHSINSRLIEIIFSETDNDALLEQIFHILQVLNQKTSSRILFDLGIFCYDLKQFKFKPETVIRRWASTYFHSLHGQKEDDNV